ncbi:MAG TPA: hypothetical protein VFO55_02895 [Gemmatimonadaceae bacterium]|nr:hypothetical protein [Gemmatimonadaceae bacterium]
MRFKALSMFAVAIAAVSLASCSEDLGAGGSCPLLCPQESAPLRDTIVDAVVLDTSAVGFPDLGFESELILAHRRDSLDSRIISRYDSIPQNYTFGTTDSAIVRIDSAFIAAPLPRADSLVAFADDGAIEVYDVTDAVDDTAVADLMAQFTAANRIGTTSYLKGQSPDTIIVQLDTARVRERVLVTRNLRIGIRMVSASSEQVRIVSGNSGGGVLLVLYPNRAKETVPLKVLPQSFSPKDPSYLRFPLADFAISVGTLPLGANTLRVGGLPSSRVLMRFAIPRHIVDSSVIVRATLLLTQRPSTAPDAGSSVAVHIVPIVASSQVTDLHAQLEFAGSNFTFPVDSLSTVPKDSGRVSLEMVTLLRAWKGQDTIKTPRLAALYLSSEAKRAASFDFFSTEADPALRPRLRITYVSRVNTGQP